MSLMSAGKGLHVFHVVSEQMQAGDPGLGAPMAVAGAQSRSEDEELPGVKDVKRTATQAFGIGVPKRRSSSRSVNTSSKQFMGVYICSFCCSKYGQSFCIVF